jgi:hypothetical protein
MMNKLQDLANMNLKPLPNRPLLVAHKDLNKHLFLFVVLNLKSFVGILGFGFLFFLGRLQGRLDMILQFQTILNQLVRRMDLNSFVPF